MYKYNSFFSAPFEFLIQTDVLNSVFFLSIKVIIISSSSNINEAYMHVSPPRHNSIIEVFFVKTVL